MPDVAFADVPRTPRGHFLIHMGAAISQLVHYQLGREPKLDLDDLLDRHEFLRGYCEDLQANIPLSAGPVPKAHWWQAQIDIWEGSYSGHLPLRALTARGMPYESRLALLLAGLVEIDSRFGTLFGQLQPLGFRRPTPELLGLILAAEAEPEATVRRTCRPLLDDGYLTPVHRDTPRLEWELAVPGPLWDLIRGEEAGGSLPWCQIHPSSTLPLLSELILPADLCGQLERLPPLLKTGQIRTLVVRGMKGSERREVLMAVARALGRTLVELEVAALATGGPAELLGPLCTLAGAMPAIVCDPAPGETATLPELRGCSGPVGALMGFEGGIDAPGMDRCLVLTLPLPDQALRRRYWAKALPGQDSALLGTAAERYHLPGGHILRVGAMALSAAALAGRAGAVRLEDIQAASRALNRQSLETLAVRLEAVGTWAKNLVAPEQTHQTLKELKARCRHRDQLLSHLGQGVESRTNRGVRILFQGPSGTGKTLAARLLAAELGMDMYRVDLAAVVNKYIGETEKNLHRVLSAAEELDVILLLDEGDSMLGKRSEVKSANDRYANLETNYLLQRLENYQGIVVVTTNAGDLIDQAFRRRMDVVVSFPPPQWDERLAIWQLHLPAEHEVPAQYLREVAMRCILTGGQIRNVVIHAALLALGGGGLISRAHLLEALLAEYRKAGALCPMTEAGNGGRAEPYQRILAGLKRPGQQGG